MYIVVAMWIWSWAPALCLCCIYEFARQWIGGAKQRTPLNSESSEIWKKWVWSKISIDGVLFFVLLVLPSSFTKLNTG